MSMLSSIRIFILLCVCATSSRLTNGFVVERPMTVTRSQTPISQCSFHKHVLHVANPSLEAEIAALKAGTMASGRSLRWELPKNAQPFREDAQKVEALLNVEVSIGRIAMVAALVLFAVEITTGKSLPEQLGMFH